MARSQSKAGQGCRKFDTIRDRMVRHRTNQKADKTTWQAIGFLGGSIESDTNGADTLAAQAGPAPHPAGEKFSRTRHLYYKSATISARSSSVTSGLLPNQSSNPGTA